MMVHEVRINALLGPGKSSGDITIPDVEEVRFDFAHAKLLITIDAPDPSTISPPTAASFGSQFREFDLAGVTSVTVTITGRKYSFNVQ